MKKTIGSGVIAAVAVLSGMSLLTGCSGPREDVRVTFCKDLVGTRLGTQPVQWKGSESEIRRPEYARITLTFELGGAPMEAACYYAYATVDENVITQADPLSAYATVPYRVTLAGEDLGGRDLREAVMAAAKKQGRELADKVEKGVKEVAGRVREELDR